MASTSTPESGRTILDGDNENGSGSAASHFQKTVCLHDWWLVRAENDFNGRRLAVAGLTSQPEQPVRIFTSAPIVKRYDIFTLETADGICVVIKGFINKLRTTDNGFSTEVFKHFVFGFPPNWEIHAENCFDGEVFEHAATGNISDKDKLHGESENAGMNACTPTKLNSPLSKNSPGKEGKEKANISQSNFGRKSSDRLRNLKNYQKSPLGKNLDDKSFGSETERSKIDSAPACFNSMTYIVHNGRCDSQGEISNLLDGELSLSMHGDLLQKDYGCLKDGSHCSPEDNGARQGLNHVDDMAQDVGQSMDVIKTAVSFTDLAGSQQKIGIDTHEKETKNKGKEEKASLKKAKRKILFDASESPITRQGKERNSIISPECLSYGRSRSGRLLLPTMEFWRNQLPVYDADRRIRGIQEGLPIREPPRGSRTEPRRKR